MGGINHQTWGALLLFYHYSHEQKYQKLTALQAGFQWPFQDPRLEVPTIYFWPIFQA